MSKMFIKSIKRIIKTIKHHKDHETLKGCGFKYLVDLPIRIIDTSESAVENFL